MADEDDIADNPDGVWCRHLMICRTVWFDPTRPDDGFSLGKVLVQTRPDAPDEFPVRFDRLFAYAQLSGAAGVYTVRVRLVRVAHTGYGEEVEEAVLWNDEPVVYGPWEIELFREEYFEAFAFPLTRLRFDEPGEYEFQLCVDELEDPLARERLYVRE